MPTKEAAKIIVDGLAGTKHKIIFPWYARLLSLVVRIWPGFGRFSAAKTIEQFRAARKDANQL